MKLIKILKQQVEYRKSEVVGVDSWEADIVDRPVRDRFSRLRIPFSIGGDCKPLIKLRAGILCTNAD